MSQACTKYNDSIDSDGIGYDRVSDADHVSLAMNASDQQFAFSAFAIAR